MAIKERNSDKKKKIVHRNRNLTYPLPKKENQGIEIDFGCV